MWELREGLRKHGESWHKWPDEDSTTWQAYSNPHTATESMDGTLIVTGLTPAQAIAATLGRDQRNCHNISDFNPVDVFTCSECGSSFKVSQFKVDVDGVLDDETEFEFVPKHCPWCGAKVIDE